MLKKFLLYFILPKLVLLGTEDFFYRFESNISKKGELNYSTTSSNNSQNNTIEKNHSINDINQIYQNNISKINLEETCTMINRDNNFQTNFYNDIDYCSNKFSDQLNYNLNYINNNDFIFQHCSSMSTYSFSLTDTDSSNRENMDCTFYKTNEICSTYKQSNNQNNYCISENYLSSISFEDLIPDIEETYEDNENKVDKNFKWNQDCNFDIQKSSNNDINEKENTENCFLKNIPSNLYEKIDGENFFNSKKNIESINQFSSNSIKINNNSIKYYNINKEVNCENVLNNEYNGICDMNNDKNCFINKKLYLQENDKLQNKIIVPEFEEISKCVDEMISDQDFFEISEFFQEQELIEPILYEKTNMSDLQVCNKEIINHIHKSSTEKYNYNNDDVLFLNENKIEKEIIEDSFQSNLIYKIIDDLLNKDQNLKKIVEKELKKLQINEEKKNNKIYKCTSLSLKSIKKLNDLNDKKKPKKVFSLKNNFRPYQKKFEKDFSKYENISNNKDKKIEIYEISSDDMIEISSDENVDLCKDDDDVIFVEKKKKHN